MVVLSYTVEGVFSHMVDQHSNLDQNSYLLS